MNPFLRAREEALKLREELIGKQAWLPVSSKDLLSRVEEVLGVLGIQEVPKSSGVLRGAKATLRRTDGFIYCRDDYDWPKKAYLIAHELGHFKLDPDVDEDDLHRDAEEFVPASPSAAYVEAYGARERDELQKNVFGRELLLPRQVARSMFFAGQGPRAIAKDLGIPLEVARQQVKEQPYLLADGFTVADLNLAAVLQRLAMLGGEHFPHATAWHQRCLGRPAAQRAMALSLLLVKRTEKRSVHWDWVYIATTVATLACIMLSILFLVRAMSSSLA